MAYEIKDTTFEQLELGARFESKSGAQWFKEKTNRAVGLKPNQGPKGRHWDYFKKDDPVRGEVRIK